MDDLPKYPDDFKAFNGSRCQTNEINRLVKETIARAKEDNDDQSSFTETGDTLVMVTGSLVEVYTMTSIYETL